MRTLLKLLFPYSQKAVLHSLLGISVLRVREPIQIYNDSLSLHILHPFYDCVSA